MLGLDLEPSPSERIPIQAGMALSSQVTRWAFINLRFGNWPAIIPLHDALPGSGRGASA